MSKDGDIDHAWRVAQRHHQAGRLKQAESFCQQLLRRAPDHTGALHLLGLIALRQGDATRAIGLLEGAVRAGGDARMHRDLGEAWSAHGDEERALACYRQALALDPVHVEALLDAGAILTRRNALAEAIELYRRVVALRPDLPLAHYNLGCVLFLSGATDEAGAAYERALALEPSYIDALLNLGLVRGRQRRYEEAIACYRRILAAHPDFASAHVNLASILVTLRRHDEAAESALRAIALQPASVLAHYNLAVARFQGGRPDEAAASARQVLALRPGAAEAGTVLSQALLRQGNVEEAISCLRELLRVNPRHAPACAALAYALLYAGGDDTELLALMKRYADIVEAPLRAQWPTHANTRDPARRLKLAYLSPDLREHSVATFLEPVIAHHDHGAFEVYCYHNHDKFDAVSERLRAHADHWIPCVAMSEGELAARVQADGIDILVDLAGHTSGGCPGVLARKPAPVQASWLGYPATTGLEAMDWRICTLATDPPGEERWHSERLYRLPRSLWCYRPRDGHEVVRRDPPMLERGGEVRFGSMNNLAKVSVATIETWAGILRAVPGSRLAMTGIPEGEARRLLRQRFGARGIEEERLLIHGRLGDADYAVLLDTIDIALDPFPYNGTTTTCETLWRGVPVVSLEGERSVARSGYALLGLLELDWLCAKDRDRYVELAVGLARDPARLTALRGELRVRFEASALRDEAGFTRELEQAYHDMWSQWCAVAGGGPL